MGKQIPVSLQAEYDSDATTTCLLSRVRCRDGDLFGFTDLDVDLIYNPATVDPGGTGDDWGSLTHTAENGGFSLASLDMAADLSVDNTELSIVPSDTGLTEQVLLAGKFDGAEVRIYRVNYLDLSMGHECVAAGRLGNTRVSENVGFVEFLSLTDLLKEPEVDLWTIACPKKLGSATHNGSTGCPKAFTWTNFTVTSVDGLEPARKFGTGIAPADDYYRIGVVEMLTGDNAGAQMDVDGNTGGAFELALELAYPNQVGDTGRVRKDCSKEWDDADNGCLFHWPTERALYFGGFPDIPVADGGTSLIPGAELNRDD